LLTIAKLKEIINYKVSSFILYLKKEINGYKPNTKVIVGITFNNNSFSFGVVPYNPSTDDLDFFIKYEEFYTYDDAISNIHLFITKYCKNNKPLTKM